MARELVASNPMAGRLEKVLNGRTLAAWAKRVGLSSGTATRLWAGNPPDPAKLVPAARIENMSLSWLIAGLGDPHLVEVPLSDQHAAQLLDYYLGQSETEQVLVIWSNVGFTPVIHSEVKDVSDGFGYTYQRVRIIGSGMCRFATVDMLTRYAERYNTAKYARVKVARVYDEFQQNLAMGQQGVYAIFDNLKDGAIIDRAIPLLPTDTLNFHGMSGQVSDIRGSAMTSDQIRLQDAYNNLVSEDRATALRLVLALANTPTPTLERYRTLVDPEPKPTSSRATRSATTRRNMHG